MLPEFLIAVSSTLQLWLGGAAQPQLATQPVEVAQAVESAVSSAAARDTDRAALAVRATVAERKRVVAEKSRMAARYEADLQEIDRLKQRRASWRRDNAIKRKKRESQATGLELAKLDRRIRSLDVRLRKEHAALVRAIDRELKDAALAMDRRGELVKLRKATRRALRRNKKIVLPDYTIDPLADPEELEYQAERIAQSEKELARELELLGKRAERFRKMAKLDEKRRRAREVGKWDDNRPRRTSLSTALAGGRDSAYGDSDGAQNEGNSPAPLDDSDPGEAGALGGGDDYSDPSVVLVDVVDSETIDVLRNAELSGSLLVKAKATERAHRKVREQIERLEKLRKQIERRAQKLRR